MAVFESLFDIIYLATVIAMGVKLLFLDNKESNLVGIMALTLGIGDSFHLLPRVFSHMSVGGFEKFAKSLSWGQFVTGITMTVFYVIFYFYYSKLSGDRDSKKKITIYALAIARIILLLLPQNNWGGEGNYKMGIIRNIPFLIMGILLIAWTYKNRSAEGLKKSYLWILLSFLFYIPVVLFVDKVPAVGALMMPKTIAYVLLILECFKHYSREFNLKSLYDMSLTFLIMGFAGGVFYREFTKYNSFTGNTHLGKVHVHTIILGFVVTMLLFLIIRNQGDITKNILKPFKIYVAGLVLTVCNMMVYGIYDVLGEGKDLISTPMLAGFAGIGHILLSVGLVWVLLKIKRDLKIEA